MSRASSPTPKMEFNKAFLYFILCIPPLSAPTARKTHGVKEISGRYMPPDPGADPEGVVWGGGAQPE